MTTEMSSLIRVLPSALVIVGAAVWLGTRIARKMEGDQERIYGALTKNCVRPEPADTNEPKVPRRLEITLRSEDAMQLLPSRLDTLSAQSLFAGITQTGYAHVDKVYRKTDGTTCLIVSVDSRSTSTAVYRTLRSLCNGPFMIKNLG